MEEETSATEEVQGDAGGSGGESGADSVLTPTKRARGRPKGSKELQVWVTHVNLTDLGSNLVQKVISGSENASPKRKRGRPKGSPNKRTVNKQVAGQNVSNGGPLKKGRGRPKGPTPVKRKADGDDGVSSPPRKRGRPKGSVNKKPRLAESREVNASNGDTPKRGRGRPKGSLAKIRRGRGRPRKYPLPSAEELKKPRVWKPLGRPRIHPRVDPAEEPPSTPHRGRGRPRKEESKKKGAHLRRSVSSAAPSSRPATDGSPRKRGRPPGAGPAQKRRGRPKGSVNKKVNAAQLGSDLPGRRAPRHARGKKDRADGAASREPSGRRKTERVSYAEHEFPEYEDEEEEEEEEEEVEEVEQQENDADAQGTADCPGAGPLDEKEVCTGAD